jgi:hypothetical protein
VTRAQDRARPPGHVARARGQGVAAGVRPGRELAGEGLRGGAAAERGSRGGRGATGAGLAREGRRGGAAARRGSRGGGARRGRGSRGRGRRGGGAVGQGRAREQG